MFFYSEPNDVALQVVPDAPTNLVSTISDSSVVISFTPGESYGLEIINYQYQLNGGDWLEANPSVADSPIFISGLTNGQNYLIKLRAVCSGNIVGAESDSISATPIVPAAPTINSVVPGDGNVTISFIVGSFNGYIISNYQYQLNGGSWTSFSPADITSPLTITGLTNGQTYSIVIRALANNGVAGDVSNTVSATPVVSTDPYFSNVSLLLKFDGSFYDSSSTHRTMSSQGTPRIITTNKKYGTGSGEFINGYLNAGTMNFGTGDFTIEAWGYKSTVADSVYRGMFSLNQYTNGLVWRFTNAGRWSCWVTNTHFETPSVVNFPVNQWNHMALTKSGNTFRMFINGSQIHSFSKSSVNLSSGTVLVGTVSHNANVERFGGLMDDYRITLGVARYTTNFTPPVSMPTS